MKRTRWLALAAVIGMLAWPVHADQGPTCADCHDDVAAAMANNIHMRIKSFEVGGHQVGCQACHGNGAKHMETGDPSFIRTFAKKTQADEEVCLSCHQLKGLDEWHASIHATEGVTCFDCHTIHTKTNPLDACKKCHADVIAQFQLPSHHPVREGKMSCVSCHDPHAATNHMLKTHGRTNDLCYTCHQDKEGPFIFEHEPVEENCLICHKPHGSVANNLLVANEPMLCLQCHEFHFHAGLRSPDGPITIGGTLRQNVSGEHSINRAFSTKCTQCHPNVHGSDLPSQTVPGMGRALTR